MGDAHWIHVEGRRWFQRTYGNTYNSVAITVDGDTTVLGRAYGYGDYYLQRAQEWLGENGFPELAERYDNGSSKVCFTIWLREHKGSYSVVDVGRQKDLHK